MHVPWNPSRMERASLGTLLFTKREAKRMRSQVGRRVQEGAEQLASR